MTQHPEAQVPSRAEEKDLLLSTFWPRAITSWLRLLTPPQRAPLGGPSHRSHRCGASVIPKEPRNTLFQGIPPSLKTWGDLLLLRLGRRMKQQRLIYLPSIPPYVVYAHVYVCVCPSCWS